MTSKERHEARYQRRKASRAAKLVERNTAVGSVEDVFTYRDMFRYGKKCCNGVRRKGSTQRFEMHLFSITAVQRRQILQGKWKPKPCVHFTLRERGKIRPIDAPHIYDRQIHKTFTHKVLIPLYSPYMIFDNGASQRGKGLQFAFKRLRKYLSRFFRLYGLNGYMVLADLTKFFPSAPKRAIAARHDKLILDERLRCIAHQLIDVIPGDYGLPLGVEPSQIEMVALPSGLDNYLCCQYGAFGFSHYMDDYCAIAHTPTEGRALLSVMTNTFAAQELTVSRSKSRVVPIRHFKYCKATFIMTDTGKIVMHGNRDSRKRTRHKIPKLCAEAAAGRQTWAEVDAWAQTALSYYDNYNDHNRALHLARRYYAIKQKEVALYGVHRDKAV